MLRGKWPVCAVAQLFRPRRILLVSPLFLKNRLKGTKNFSFFTYYPPLFLSNPIQYNDSMQQPPHTPPHTLGLSFDAFSRLQLPDDKFRFMEASLSNPWVFLNKVILGFCSIFSKCTAKQLAILHLNILVWCYSVAFCCVNYIFIHSSGLLFVQHSPKERVCKCTLEVQVYHLVVSQAFKVF